MSAAALRNGCARTVGGDEGSDVGFLVGCSVGGDEGSDVGFLVGCSVGGDEGSDVGWTPVG